LEFLLLKSDSDPVDFRDQAGIYALYADSDLLYVGQTGGKGQRHLARNQHRRDDLAERWNMFLWFGTRAISDDGSPVIEEPGAISNRQEVLNHLEAILIHVAEPALNRQGGKWGYGVEKYLQHRDVKRLSSTVDKISKKYGKQSLKPNSPSGALAPRNATIMKEIVCRNGLTARLIFITKIDRLI
jgi:hypothetical protein